MQKKIFFIYNPKSGKSKSGQVQILEKWGRVELINLENNVDKLIRLAVHDGYKRVIVCGGDGTVQKALSEILGSNLELGIIPAGTGNILAQNLGIPFEFEKAIEVAVEGVVRKIDIGKANQEYFCLSCGVGIVAEVMRKTKSRYKKVWGLVAYLGNFLSLVRRRSKNYEVVVDEKLVFKGRAKGISVFNVSTLVAGIRAFPGLHAESGNLGLGILKTGDLRSWIDFLKNVIAGKAYESRYFDIWKAEKIEIKVLGRPRYFECDGSEIEKVKSLQIMVLPKRLQVVVPESRIKKVILFDFDGTIADSFEIVIGVYKKLAKEYGMPDMGDNEITKLRDLGARELLKELNVSPLKVPALLNSARNEFNLNMKRVKVFKGLTKVLEELAKKYDLGIVTSNDKENVESFLNKNELGMFKFIFSERSLFGKGKVIQDLVKEFNFDARKVWYVGDEVRDIEAARDAGVKSISVTWGFNSREALKRNKPDKLAILPGDLLKWAYE